MARRRRSPHIHAGQEPAAAQAEAPQSLFGALFGWGNDERAGQHGYHQQTVQVAHQAQPARAHGRRGRAQLEPHAAPSQIHPTYSDDSAYGFFREEQQRGRFVAHEEAPQPTRGRGRHRHRDAHGEEAGHDRAYRQAGEVRESRSGFDFLFGGHQASHHGSHHAVGSPVDGGSISSGFGTRLDPITRKPGMHTGLDIRKPAGSRIKAMQGGTVTFADDAGGYGKMVEINHGNGLSTRYAHMSYIGVGYGQSVGAGQEIGRVGSTGRSTGSHLHYEVRVNGAAVDPLGQHARTAGLGVGGGGGTRYARRGRGRHSIGGEEASHYHGDGHDHGIRQAAFDYGDGNQENARGGFVYGGHDVDQGDVRSQSVPTGGHRRSGRHHRG